MNAHAKIPAFAVLLGLVCYVTSVSSTKIAGAQMGKAEIAQEIDVLAKQIDALLAERNKGGAAAEGIEQAATNVAAGASGQGSTDAAVELNVEAANDEVKSKKRRLHPEESSSSEEGGTSGDKYWDDDDRSSASSSSSEERKDGLRNGDLSEASSSSSEEDGGDSGYDDAEDSSASSSSSEERGLLGGGGGSIQGFGSYGSVTYGARGRSNLGGWHGVVGNAGYSKKGGKKASKKVKTAVVTDIQTDVKEADVAEVNQEVTEAVEEVKQEVVQVQKKATVSKGKSSKKGSRKYKPALTTSVWGGHQGGWIGQAGYGGGNTYDIAEIKTIGRRGGKDESSSSEEGGTSGGSDDDDSRSSASDSSSEERDDGDTDGDDSEDSSSSSEEGGSSGGIDDKGHDSSSSSSSSEERTTIRQKGSGSTYGSGSIGGPSVKVSSYSSGLHDTLYGNLDDGAQYPATPVYTGSTSTVYGGGVGASSSYSSGEAYSPPKSNYRSYWKPVDSYVSPAPRVYSRPKSYASQVVLPATVVKVPTRVYSTSNSYSAPTVISRYIPARQSYNTPAVYGYAPRRSSSSYGGSLGSSGNYASSSVWGAGSYNSGSGESLYGSKRVSSERYGGSWGKVGSSAVIGGGRGSYQGSSSSKSRKSYGGYWPAQTSSNQYISSRRSYSPYESASSSVWGAGSYGGSQMKSGRYGGSYGGKGSSRLAPAAAVYGGQYGGLSSYSTAPVRRVKYYSAPATVVVNRGDYGSKAYSSSRSYGGYDWAGDVDDSGERSLTSSITYGGHGGNVYSRPSAGTGYSTSYQRPVVVVRNNYAPYAY